MNTASKTIAIQILFTYIQTYYRQYIKWVIVIRSKGKTWFVKKKLQLENEFHSVSSALRSQICIGFYLIDIFSLVFFSYLWVQPSKYRFVMHRIYICIYSVRWKLINVFLFWTVIRLQVLPLCEMNDDGNTDVTAANTNMRS